MKWFLFSFFVIPNWAWAWGALGHRVTGAIAEKHLGAEARKAVREILGDETLWMASTWADHIRSDKEKRIDFGRRMGNDLVKKLPDGKVASAVNLWHIYDVPDEIERIEKTKRSKQGDLLSAFEKMVSVLKNKKSSAMDRREALRFLVHVIGDLHQPLHIGLSQNKGANMCWVNWYPEKYNKNIKPRPKKKNEYVNLHAFWDSKLIESRELNFSQYAAYLNRPNPRILENSKESAKNLEKLSTQELQSQFKNRIRDWQSVDVRGWMNESRNLRDVVYLNEPRKNGHTRFCFGSFREVVNHKDIPRIGWDERYIYLQVAERRLLQAGVRIASTLNSIFD